MDYLLIFIEKNNINILYIFFLIINKTFYINIIYKIYINNILYIYNS